MSLYFCRTENYIFEGVPEDNTLPQVEPVCRVNQGGECECDWDSYVTTCGVKGNYYAPVICYHGTRKNLPGIDFCTVSAVMGNT